MPTFTASPRRPLALAATLAAVLWSSSALAGPREDFMAALEASWKAVGATDIKFGAISGTDSRFVIADMTVKMTIGDEAVTLTSGPTTLVDAKSAADQSYTVGELTGTDLVMTSADGKVSLAGFTVTNYGSPAPAALKEMYEKTKSVKARYDSITANGIAIVETDDGKTASIESLQFKAGDWKDYLPRIGSGSIKGVTPPMDEAGRKELGAYGYNAVVFDVEGSGKWDDVAGTIAVDRLDVNFRDMATLKLNFTVEGVTAAVYEEMSRLGEAADDAAKARQMELLQNLSVRGAQVRLENNSIVQKVIDKQAKDAGMPSKDFVQTMTLTLPVMLASLKNKAFEKEIAVAVKTFLADPKALTIRLTPKAPVSFAQIVGSAMMAPNTLPGMLSASVKAND